MDLRLFSSLEKPDHPFFPLQQFRIAGICHRERILSLFLILADQRHENLFELLDLMEPDLPGIEEFCYRILVMEIAVVERDERIHHCILEISQIEFYDPVDEDIGIRQCGEIIFPQRRLFCPIAEREMEFPDGFLIRSRRISFLELLEQCLRLLHISEISEQSYLTDQRICEALLHHILGEQRKYLGFCLFLEQRQFIDRRDDDRVDFLFHEIRYACLHARQGLVERLVAVRPMRKIVVYDILVIVLGEEGEQRQRLRA